RIDQLIWLSDMDKKAFYKQHEMYGYEWHFIGCIDIGCFNIHDLARGEFHPRYVLRYPHLEALMAKLGPTIMHYDRILTGQSVAPRSTRAGVITELVQNLTQRDGHVAEILVTQDEDMARLLAKQVATECQLRGLTQRQVVTMLQRTLPTTVEREYAEVGTVRTFKTQLIDAYDSLAHLV
ncbi:MAG TPA: hypothetical protein V6D47_15760, partial [Oscillatoriaceae cyanobacterium]